MTNKTSTKFAIAVNNFGSNEIAFNVIKATNNHILESSVKDFCCIGLYEVLEHPCLPMLFPTMQIFEMWGFDGVAIATNVSTALRLIEAGSPCRKIFYVYDLEWMRYPQKEYGDFSRIYRSGLELITRSESHAKVVENAWNVKVSQIMPKLDFNKCREEEILQCQAN